MQEVDYVVALVHNLGVAASLEAGEPALTRGPVDLVALIGRVRGRHAPLARRRGVVLVSAVPAQPVVALGDVTAIEQAVNNLVHNAVRYNREGGHVALVLDVEGGGGVCDRGARRRAGAARRGAGAGERARRAGRRGPHTPSARARSRAFDRASGRRGARLRRRTAARSRRRAGGRAARGDHAVKPPSSSSASP